MSVEHAEMSNFPVRGRDAEFLNLVRRRTKSNKLTANARIVKILSPKHDLGYNSTFQMVWTQLVLYKTFGYLA